MGPLVCGLFVALGAKGHTHSLMCCQPLLHPVRSIHYVYYSVACLWLM